MSAVTESVTPLPAWAASVLRAAAASALGTKFVHLGKTEAGMDCRGLILFLHRRIGVGYELDAQESHYSSNYFRNGGDALYRYGILKRCVPVSRPSTGDIAVFYAAGSTTNYGHAGVVMDGDAKTFVHAYHRRGVRVDRWTDRAWSRIYGGAFRPTAFATIPKERR